MAESPSRDYHLKPRVSAVSPQFDKYRFDTPGRTWEIDCRACGRLAVQSTFRGAQLIAKHHSSPITKRITVAGVEIDEHRACTPDTRFARLTERIIHENKTVLDRLADL